MFKLIFSLILGFICGFIIAGLIVRRKKKEPIQGPIKSKSAPAEAVSLDKLYEQEFSGVDTEERIRLREEISFIFKLNEKLSLALKRASIAQYILEDVQRFLNTSTCVLLLYDEKRKGLSVEYVIGPEADALKDFFLLRGESISGAVMNAREPVMVNDLENNFYYKSINKENYLKNSFISAPLLLKDEVIGVLNIANKKSDHPFTQGDLEFLLNVARVGAIAFKNARLHEQIQEDYLKTMVALALIIDARDPYTERHSQNVTRYSLAIAQEMALNLKQTEVLRRAALVHDIGKIGVRDNVLMKPGRFTPEEFEQIKIHSVKGEEIVSSLPFLKEVSVLVRHHHERYDGEGYPDGKIGEGIELGSRILAVADAFDAMTTDRPYRKKLTLEEAKEKLKRNKFIQFDPQIVEYFLKALDKNPGILQ